MPSTPLVSIVLATYNRSVILAHAIESVRRSTFDSWELIVVGDCCTDDSAAVVAACADSRIRWINLARNTGEQSGPNNEGVRLARGRYLAFLNHDDLYFPDHLATAVEHLERTGADFVWAPVIMAMPMTAAELAGGRWAMRVIGVTPGDGYDPHVFVFASAWLMTRDVAARVGPWRHAHETFATPSQDWLFRAWRSGACMRMLTHPTVLAVPATPRKGSYVTSASPEHSFFAALMRDDARFRERAMAAAVVSAEREARQYRVWRALRSLVVRPITTSAMRMGMHPYAPMFALRYGRRGNLVNRSRRQTGLGRMPRQDGT